MPLTSDQIAEFLSKLDTDDDFRDKLKTDTAEALAELDIPYDPSATPPPSAIILPEKGAVAASYDAYKNLLFPSNEFSANTHEWDVDETAE